MPDSAEIFAAVAKSALHQCLKHLALAMVFIVTGTFSATPASAENGCPNGYEPWKIPIQSMSDCMPIPDYGQSELEPRLPEKEWASRWGAIAIGSTDLGGGVGVSSNMESERMARKSAMQRCIETGGGPACEVLTYHDQCAVIYWGSSHYSVETAATVEEASANASQRCGQHDPDCTLYYSDCSYAVQLR